MGGEGKCISSPLPVPGIERPYPTRWAKPIDLTYELNAYSPLKQNTFDPFDDGGEEDERKATFSTKSRVEQAVLPEGCW